MRGKDAGSEDMSRMRKYLQSQLTSAENADVLLQEVCKRAKEAINQRIGKIVPGTTTEQKVVAGCALGLSLYLFKLMPNCPCEDPNAEYIGLATAIQGIVVYLILWHISFHGTRPFTYLEKKEEEP